MRNHLQPGRIATPIVWRHLSEIAHAQAAWGRGPWSWRSFRIFSYGWNKP